MDIIRERFVKKFGDTEADAIESAAVGHGNGINDLNHGSSEFRWSICICLGYECMEIDRFREYHGIYAPWKEIKQWIKDYAELDQHNGDLDYLSAFLGVYNEYMPDRSVIK